jgi:hypothetical protein
MSRILPRQPRLRLDSELYERLRKQVLRRDGWRCQWCSVRSNLEVHHREFSESRRGRLGREPDYHLFRVPFACAWPPIDHSAVQTAFPRVPSAQPILSQIAAPVFTNGSAMRRLVARTYQLPRATSVPGL